MLCQITVKNFAIAEHVEVLFQNGMTVLSGETGAGKSIILDALGLTLGDRADTSMVRQGCDKAEVSAVFQLDAQPDAEQWLKEHDLDDDKQCILRRIITAEGRSRAYINGHPCPLMHLKTLGEMLIDVHSQHEHQSLLNKDNHRSMIDDFGQHTGLAKDVTQTFKQWQKLADQLSQLENNRDETEARMQLLGFQLNELEQLDLQEGEVAKLEKDQHELSHAEQFLSQAHTALAISNEGESNTLAMLNASIQSLSGLSDDHTQLQEALSLFHEAQIQVEEASSSLRAFIEHLEVDPARLQGIEERLSVIYQLARKHRCQPEELCALRDRLSEEQASLGQAQDLDALNADLAAQRKRYDQQAKELRECRQKSASKLEKGIAQQLSKLGMKDARFQVAFSPYEGKQLSPHGLDSIEFMISTNAGQSAKPLKKVASGGELSRISLAIQVVIAQCTAIPTLVFDEVDVGIGGGTAHVVGQLLRQLGKSGQIICVTHQPQVASCGDHHFVISKKTKGGQVKSTVTALSAKERTQEVARMLGGAEITAQTVAHAEEMLAFE